jgi:hypothetical protein
VKKPMGEEKKGSVEEAAEKTYFNRPFAIIL